ncbi:MAG: histidine kinase [Hespellia sp.]|nr:histidine kinase [Hespellia sp.]
MNQFFVKLREKYLRKIRYQMVLLLLFITALPIVSIQLINIYTTSHITSSKNQAILNDNLLLSKNAMNTQLAAYKEVLFHLSTDSIFMNNMIALDKDAVGTASYKRTCDSLDTCIVSNIVMYPEIQGIGVISTNGIPYMYAQARNQTRSLVKYFGSNYMELPKTVDSSNKPSIHVIPYTDVNYDIDNPVFYLSTSIFHYEKLKYTGTLILFISPEQLNSTINQSTSEIYDYTDRFLLTEDNYIICAKENLTGHPIRELDTYKPLNTMSSSSPSKISNSDKSLISVIPTDYFNLNLVENVDYYSMNHSLRSLWMTVTSLMIAILILTLLVAYTFGKKFILPLEKIATAMKSFDEEHLNNPIEEFSKNEIGDIEHSYNLMLSQISELLTENKEQTRHLIEMNRKACNAELKSLELQINPHFIFNTLDTINWTAISDGCITVSEQLNALAGILRYTVYHMNQIVPLCQDINWIEQYLQLQRIRFHNQFTYDLFVEENALKLPIHKLLLQPFLENALIHGFDGITYPGYLRVDCTILKNSILCIKVTDNGRGIQSEQLKKIRFLFSSDLESDSSSIGLSNITYRTREYYKMSRLMVASYEHCTCFKLFIPIKEMR